MRITRSSDIARGSAVAAILVIAGCSINSGNPAGFDYTGRGPSGVVADTVAVSGADTSWSAPLPLDDSEVLFTGQYSGFEGTALLRFAGFPTGATVQGARLILNGRAKSATEDSLLSLDLSVAEITSDWDPSWTGADLPSLTTGPALDSILLPYSAGIDTFGLQLPPALVQSWVDDPSARGRGVAVIPASNAPYLLYLDAVDSPGTRTSLRPRLRVRYTPSGGGAVQTITLNPGEDTSLLAFTDTPPADELWVAGGSAWRAMLTFPLPGVPSAATVNRAELHLTFKTTGRITAPYAIRASSPEGPTPWAMSPDAQVASGTSSSPISVAATDSTATLVVTFAAADQIEQGGGIVRILVQSASETGGIGLIRLLDATASPDRQSRLIIFYSTPPGGTQ